MIPSPPKLSWPKDWFIKLISLLFAVFLWYFVSSEDQVDMNVQVPVEIVNLPRDLVISNQYKSTLDVTISGPRGLIRKVSQGVSRSIDLSKATPGTTVVANDLDSISVPRGISILRINPTHITLRLDRLIKKELAIRPITHGKPPDDLELAAITMKPEVIEVSGPQSILAREQNLQTEPIDISGLKASTTKQTTLALNPELADLIGDPVVSAQIEIKDKLTDRDIGKIDIAPVGLSLNQTVKITPGKLEVKTMMPTIMARKPNKELKGLFTANVNLEGLPPGSHEVKPTVTVKPSDPLPPGVTLQQVNEVGIQQTSPETVTVEIK